MTKNEPQSSSSSFYLLKCIQEHSVVACLAIKPCCLTPAGEKTLFPFSVFSGYVAAVSEIFLASYWKPITPLPSTKVVWRLSYHRPYQGQGRQRTNLGLCRLVLAEPPPAQHWEDQRAGGGFLQAQTKLPTGEHPGNRHWDGDIVQVPGSSHEQQTGLDWSHCSNKKGQSRLLSSGPLECRGHPWLLSMTMWWHQPFSIE